MRLMPHLGNLGSYSNMKINLITRGAGDEVVVHLRGKPVGGGLCIAICAYIHAPKVAQNALPAKVMNVVKGYLYSWRRGAGGTPRLLHCNAKQGEVEQLIVHHGSVGANQGEVIFFKNVLSVYNACRYIAHKRSILQRKWKKKKN